MLQLGTSGRSLNMRQTVSAGECIFGVISGHVCIRVGRNRRRVRLLCKWLTLLLRLNSLTGSIHTAAGLHFFAPIILFAIDGRARTVGLNQRHAGLLSEDAVSYQSSTSQARVPSARKAGQPAKVLLQPCLSRIMSSPNMENVAMSMSKLRTDSARATNARRKTMRISMSRARVRAASGADELRRCCR